MSFTRFTVVARSKHWRVAIGMLLLPACSGAADAVFDVDGAASFEGGADAQAEAAADSGEERDAGPLDATIHPEAGGADSGRDARPTDASHADGGWDSDGSQGDAARDAAVDAAVDAAPTCSVGQKVCGAACVATTDPAFGCGASSCAACDSAFATLACGGEDAGASKCVVQACKGSHFDCDGVGENGCESDVASDTANCGQCGHKCSAEVQHATITCKRGGQCDYTTCDPGYADADRNRSNGCETVDPSGVPEAKAGQLLLWLAQEDFVPSTGTWPDRSGHHADGTCPVNQCPTKGYGALVFSGYGGFTLENPDGIFDASFTPTVFVYAAPGRSSGYFPGTLLRLGITIESTKVQPPPSVDRYPYPTIRVCSGPCLTLPWTGANLWDGLPETIVASLDGTGLATLNGLSAQLNPLPAGDRIGTIASDYWGDISEVVVFTGHVSWESSNAVQNYLYRKNYLF